MMVLWLIGALAWAEGGADGLASQELEAETELRIDVIDPSKERIVWSGDEELQLFDPAGSKVATLEDGDGYVPSASGAYRGEISSGTTDWDIEVEGASGGRVWSTEWQFNAGSFDNGFTGSFYALVDSGDGNTSVIEFAAEGWAGFRWALSANAEGVVGAMGRSVPEKDATFVPEVPIYLNRPEVATYTAAAPGITNAAYGAGTLQCNALVPGERTGAFQFDSAAAGVSHVVCDVDGNGAFDITSDADVHLLQSTKAGAVQLDWDGTDVDGEAVRTGPLQCRVLTTVGEFHYGASDVETSYPGFRLYRVDQDGTRVERPMYWNDSAVQAAAVKMPDGQIGLETSGPDGILGGDPLVAAQPNVTARSWGTFEADSKGDGAIIDTYTWVDSATSEDDITIVVLSGDEDEDGDGLTSIDERCEFGTDPALPDTDADGLDDDVELQKTSTDPLAADSDEDGLLDGAEVNEHGTNPLVVDTDEDGCSDYVEVVEMGTDPLAFDTDGDTLGDCDEVNEYGTDPTLADTDADGVDDAGEISMGTDPLAPPTVRYTGAGCATGAGGLGSWWLLGALLLAGCVKSAQTASTPTPLPDGITMVEDVGRTGSEIVIPYRKYALDNGLTVVLHPDRSDPIVHVDVTYHVGSGREEIGRSGFAHFFEHMMFQGSENVADEEHFKIITESGGTLNGTTNTDRTNYYETVPSNQLEKMLWLEADRMGFLLPAVTQEKFEIQRETVKNERGQRVDNAPYGLLGERVGEAMYPEGHPYSWSTIGYIEDLNRADLDDLKRFFLRWYGPNNATLTVGGDFDEAQALAWVSHYFGSIPAGPAVEPPVPSPVTLDADRYISLEDEVALPLVYMSWPTVHGRHPDEAPLDVLMNILGVGRTSLLYKNLVRDGIAVDAQAGHGCRELHCSFTLYALPNPQSGKNLADLESTLRASLAEFETRGVLDDDLQRVKMGIVSDMVYGLESVSRKVSQLAAYQTFTGNPNYIRSDIERYESVTKADVVRVYEQYIKGKPAVIMSVVPKGQLDMIAHEDTWQRYERTIPERSDEGVLAMRVPEDSFDRSQQPPSSGSNPSIQVPPIWRATVRGEVPVIGAVNDETPTTAVQLRLEVGQILEPLDKLGLAAMAAAMLDEATTDSSVEDLSNRLDKLGSSITVSSGDRATTVTIRTLSENLDETVRIAAEKLLRPKLDPADFDRVKGQTLQELEVAKTNASVTASDVFRRIAYGPENAFAHPDNGQTSTVGAITVDDVRTFIDEQYSASRLSVVAVSDLPSETVTASLESALEGLWTTKAGPQPEVVEPAPLKAGTLYLIDKPGAAQSEIRIGKRSLPRDFTGRFYRATLMNYVLGGAFNSRINLNLREDKGYTYGAGGGFYGDVDIGRYTVGAGVRTDATAASITEIVKELTNFVADGPTAEELAFTKASIGQRDAREYETPRQKLRFLANILTYDLPDDFVDVQKGILGEVTEAELDALAAELIGGPDEMIFVVVGDKATILPSLEELGYPIVELSPDGAPVP